MKPIDKLKGNILVSYNNITGLIDEIHFKPYTDKLNQLISSHNKLMKVMETQVRLNEAHLNYHKLNKE